MERSVVGVKATPVPERFTEALVVLAWKQVLVRVKVKLCAVEIAALVMVNIPVPDVEFGAISTIVSEAMASFLPIVSFHTPVILS